MLIFAHIIKMELNKFETERKDKILNYTTVKTMKDHQKSSKETY